MSVDREIERLLASISDGQPVDWDRVEHETPGPDRDRLQVLHEVSRIADFNRGLQRGPEGSAPPERWGDLLLLERIGQGAHAEVYRAWDPALQREVALKLLRPERESGSLLEEGRALAKIRHPHAVTVHGVDQGDGRIGLWMELVRGPSLEQEVRSAGPLDVATARRLGIEMGSALAATHAAALLHRDLKPANVVRDPERRYVLTDFGLGARWDAAASRGSTPSGTPMYMAPELFAGAAATERSDLYSLGMTLWFALAGRHPFDAKTLDELIEQVRRGPRPKLRELRPELPESLTAIVERAIAVDPDARFTSASQWVQALESAAAPARRRAPWPALAAAALLLAITIVVAMRGRRVAPSTPPPSPAPAVETYAVEAAFLRRDTHGATPLVTGDRVRPGDRLSLELRATRPAWVYVLNEDEHGERYLLFPQPRFDLRNPLPADSTWILPGGIGGKENAWTVTSPGGREYFLVVASPEPVPEIEADLERLPTARPGRPIEYAQVGPAAVERLRGVGGVSEVPAAPAAPASASRVFDRFKALAGRESGIRGTWVRQIVLENPR